MAAGSARAAGAQEGERHAPAPAAGGLALASQHLHQIIDDTVGCTLCAVSTRSKDLREQVGYGGNRGAAEAIGKALGQRATQLGIQKVSLDRRGRKYHGRIKALAEAAREAGLEF